MQKSIRCESFFSCTECWNGKYGFCVLESLFGYKWGGCLFPTFTNSDDFLAAQICVLKHICWHCRVLKKEVWSILITQILWTLIFHLKFLCLKDNICQWVDPPHVFKAVLVFLMNYLLLVYCRRTNGKRWKSGFLLCPWIKRFDKNCMLRRLKCIARLHVTSHTYAS